MTATDTPTDTPFGAGTEPPRRTRRRRAVRIGLAVLLVALAGYTAWTNTRPTVLRSSVEIDATPDQVWQVLTDFGSFPAWNPFMTSAAVTSPGGLRVGARLRIHLHDAGGGMDIDPEVLTVDPGHELRWLGRISPGWIADGEHRFTITRIGPHRVRLTQSERFTGVAVPFVAGMLRTNTLPQFGAMNDAVAQRAAALSD